VVSLTPHRATELSLNVLIRAHPLYMVRQLSASFGHTFFPPLNSVSRPLFVEEHGLRLLLEREGVGVEMSRDAYEAGEWASTVSDAWRTGEKRKLERRAGKHTPDRRAQGLKMARDVITWVNEWVAASNLTDVCST
jgi:hypothetical protein